MPLIEFQFFGSPCFRLDGKPVTIRLRKAVALAAYLAVTGTPHSREKLATLFWPESSHKQARASLRKILSLITAHLGRSWLTIDRDAIGFAPHENLQVDVNRFRELASPAARAGDNPGQITDFRAAAQLYGQSFLSGFFVGDAPDFEEWQLAQAEQLDRMAAVVLDRLARWEMDREAYPRAVSHARRLVSLDPLNEEARQLLIRLLAGAGEPGTALRQYDQFKALLKKELDIPPAEETRILAREIRETRQAGHGHPAPHPQRSGAHLPVQVTPFVGRKHEIESLVRQMTRPEVRLLTLTGPGGMGKTRLALELAKELKKNFPHGLFFIGMADLGSRQELATEIINALGLRSDRQARPEEQLVHFLRSKSALLVMDNFEHLPQGGELVSGILEQAPGIKILTTSRTRLMLKGEHLFRVAELSRPGAASARGQKTRISRSEETCDAVTLFLSAARMIRPDYTLEKEGIHGVLRICDLTGGMPLALIMAAAWVDLFSAEKIADRIQESLDFLRSEIRDTPIRHQSIRAVFDSSWAGLARKEKALLMKLSVFLRGFTLEAVSGITATDPEYAVPLMAGLTRKSLLKADPHTGRFEMHPLLRQYTLDRLSASGREDAVLDAHKHLYLDLAHQKERGLIGRTMLTCRREMDDDIHNIRQAWLRAVAQDDLQAMGRAASGLYLYYDMHTRYHQGRALFQPAGERVLAMARTRTAPVMALILLCWLDMAGEEWPCSVPTSKIGSRARQCLRLAVKRRDPRARGFSLLLMGVLAQKERAWDRAIRLFRLSTGVYPEIERGFWVSVRMGLCRQAQGRMDSAIRHFRTGQSAGAGTGDEIKKAWALCNVGICELGKGSLNSAEAELQAAGKAFNRINAPIGMKTAYQFLGLVLFLKGDLAGADALVDLALGIFKDLGLAPSRDGRSLALKGMIAIAAGHPDRGQTLSAPGPKRGTPLFNGPSGNGLSGLPGQRPANRRIPPQVCPGYPAGCLSPPPGPPDYGRPGKCLR